MRSSQIHLTIICCFALSLGSAQAQTLTTIIDLPGGSDDNYVGAMNSDGTILVGYGSSSFSEAYIWSSGSILGLGDLPTGLIDSAATGVSGDGTVVVGHSYVSAGSQAFRWTSGTGMVGLGDLPGGSFDSNASAISYDATTIVGTGSGASGFQAFRWTSGTGMVGLGDLAGGIFYSSASSVNGDGSVMTGFGSSAGGTEAFRWTSGTGMVGLGDLTGGTFDSRGNMVSRDGTTIVGRGNSTNGQEAFRWTSGTGMVGLGDLAGGGFSSNATAVNSNGSVIVGLATAASGAEIFRWTALTGMESTRQILVAGGIDLTGWTFDGAVGVDDTGNIIVGRATVGGVATTYIMNLTTLGVTIPADMLDNLSSATIVVEQSRSAMNTNIGQSLFAATQSITAFRPTFDLSNPSSIAPAAGGDARVWSGYIVGTFGAGQDNDFDNNNINGTMGLLVELDKNLVIGAGIIGSHGKADRQFSGDSILDSKGGSVIAAYEADNGIRLYGTAFVADLRIDSKRGYLNGASLDASYADIDGIGFGAALRGGYEFAVSDQTDLMPYVEMQASRTKLDGYTETGGGFPATFNDTTSDLLTSYVGTQLAYNLTPSISIGGRMAWAHRLVEDDNGITASTTGFTGTFDTKQGDKNWAEGAMTFNMQMTGDTRLGVELSGRSGKTQEPAASLTLGLVSNF